LSDNFKSTAIFWSGYVFFCWNTSGISDFMKSSFVIL